MARRLRRFWHIKINTEHKCQVNSRYLCENESCFIHKGHIYAIRETKQGGTAVRKSFMKNGYHLAYLFLIGLFIGILVVNLGHEAWIKNGSLLGTEMMSRLKSSRPNGTGMIGYILRHRLFAVCMLSLISTTMIGLPVICAYICYMGLAAGCLLSVAVIRYGIRGLLFMAALLFPQAFLLVPAYVALFLWAFELNRTIYASRANLAGYERFSNRFYLGKCMHMICIMAVVIMGCLLESYVNPNVLHLILKIF